MSEKSIELKCIADLFGKHFYIPSYQRGYRWDKEQVEDLMQDIWEFNNKDSKEKGEFYCLQPIIVKKDSEGRYRLIDGQQRLTTIFIILSYFEQHITVKNLIGKVFFIEYETRKGSKDFLSNIKNNNSIDKSNIDYYYMTTALEIIKNWEDSVTDFNPSDFVNTLLRRKITNDKDNANNVRFIWYEINDDEDEIDVFTRINNGKIPLGNAELIKALFLRKNENEDKDNIRPIEIAKEWDEIEYALQNDEFWYFLTKNRESDTRIELIFEIFADVINNDKDKFATYRYFSNKENLNCLWSKQNENIKKVFYTFKSWFEDRELYHLIGYLISSDNSLQNIYNLSKNTTKTEFRKQILEMIFNNLDIELEEIDELSYDSEKEKTEITKVLLLFNIATIINNEDCNIRFAFDKFNKEKWSLEHIHAQQDKGLEDEELHKWLNDVINELEVIKTEEAKKISSKIKSFIESKPKKITEDLENCILKFFGEAKSLHGIDNLALLSGIVNSALSNNIFPRKRTILKEKDKDGRFIPICTKNVFLKYYSKKVNKMYYWSEEDRNDYMQEIKDVLAKLKGDK